MKTSQMHWYYFGGMKWSVAWLNIWPTLEDDPEVGWFQVLSIYMSTTDGIG